MPDPSRIIPACSAHDLRWELRDVLAAAEETPTPPWLENWRRELPAGSLDPLWCFDASSVPRASCESLPVRVLAARSAVADAEREAPPRDPLASRLRHLRRGGTLAGRRLLVLEFDDDRHPSLGWLGDAGEAGALVAWVAKAAAESLPVLIRGETGTGKELVARGLHRLGPRRHRPFLAINCAELAESVLESELFGHARGAFTGAAEERLGLFESAEDGVVFLDEIGELPLCAQAKLLRVLEDHRVRRIGSSVSRPIACRIVAATHRDLARDASVGRFRADLFYRLRGAELALPPLRERRDEVLHVAEGFLARVALRARRELRLGPDARLALLGHDWPGNVRELRQAIEVAVLGCAGDDIAAADLALPSYAPSAADEVEHPLLTASAAERAHILRALESTAGNKMAAARLLGLTRQSLSRRMLRHGIPRPAFADARAALTPASERRSRP